MEQNPKYFEKTAAALQALRQTAEDLNIAADSALENKKQCLQKLRREIEDKASRIDEIIKTLNGVIK